MSFLQLEKVQAQAEKEKGSIQKEHDNNMYIIVIIIITIIITICCHHRSPLVLSQSLRYGLTQLLELLGKMLTSDRSTNEDASAWYNNNTTIIIMIINMYNNDKNNNNNNKTMMLLFQRCYLEDRVWMSHLFWGNNCLSQQKLMFVWKFSNWPLTFFMNIQRFSYLGYFENALFEVFQFPEKDQIWFMFKEMKPPMRIWQCVDGHAICAGCRLGLAIRVRITMTIADWQLQWQWPAQYSLRDKLESKGCPSCSRSVLVCGFHLIFDFLASINFFTARSIDGRNFTLEKMARSLFGEDICWATHQGWKLTLKPNKCGRKFCCLYKNGQMPSI